MTERKAKALGTAPMEIALEFEGEVLYPAELFGGVGDERVAGLGDAAEGVVGGEAFAA